VEREFYFSLSAQPFFSVPVGLFRVWLSNLNHLSLMDNETFFLILSISRELISFLEERILKAILMLGISNSVSLLDKILYNLLKY
jgi:hypothetical protein